MNGTLANQTDETNLLNSSANYNNNSSAGDVKDYFELNATFNWIYLIFFAVIVIGTCTNAIFVVALLRSRRNGVLNLVLQLSIIDALTSFAALTETWALKEKTWDLPVEMCPLFAGTEILTNTGTIYMIISFNFHVISITNLFHLQERTRRNGKNPLTSCTDDDYNDVDSNECLVPRPRSDCSTMTATTSIINNRCVTIDYRKRKDDLSVLLPSLLVWFTALSLSVPDFALSSTIRTKEDTTLCAILDLYYGKLLQIMLLAFRVIVPLPLLAVTFLVMLWKLYRYRKLTQKVPIVANEPYNVRQLLAFNLALTFCYLIGSFQRQYFYIVHTTNQHFNKESIDSFKVPPLHNIAYSEDVGFMLSILHYSSIMTRCLLYVFLLPKFGTTIKNKLCCKQ